MMADKPTMKQSAVAEFAQGILRYVDDGNVIELRDCGFVEELRQAMRAGGLDPEADDEEEDLGDEGEDEDEEDDDAD